MRLLKRVKSGQSATTYEFSLTQFNPKDIPPRYGILSHRWEQDEVRFEHLNNDTAKTRKGYKKLEFCGEQATRDGLLYFWIDTCCIDKTNNVELSEAINSMFKWYKNATKCYVYMSDVSINRNSHASAEYNWKSAFEGSKWFTRGWTLQELIAPTVVEFFSVEGERLGDKKSLEQQIHQVTGIAIEALQGEKPLSLIDVEVRFSWTTRRETTFEEDAAYCLLGIFDIQMPLLYGEGRQKALNRLRREIKISSNSESFLTTDASWIVPFERNPNFTGRKAQLTELEEKLFVNKDHTSKIAITGLGGVGKTQLVLELLCRTKEKHKDCSIMWIPATNPESLHQGYLTVAQQLEIPEFEAEKTDVKKVVQGHLSKDNMGHWVLVFDNADDIDMWTALPKPERGSRRLIDYLPNNRRGCIVFTTRDRKAAVKLAQQNIVEVPKMSEDAAMKLLTKYLASPSLVIDNPQDATALIAELTYLPLAIVQATAFINENGTTLADYLLLLKEREEEVIDLLSEEFEDSGRYQDAKKPVATTWLISFERIRQRNPLAAEYLSFMACIDPKDIPQSLLPPAPSRKKEIEAIGTLTAYSFVSKRPADLTLDLHRLVHLATRDWLRKEELLGQWTEKSITRLEEVFPDDDHNNRSIWRMYLPHARQALESDLVSDERRLALMWRYGGCLYSDGRWNDAEAPLTHVLTIEKRTFGIEHPSTLTSMAKLASTYGNQGRLEEAEKLNVQVMEIRETKLGADHPDTLNSMNNLAATYWKQGRWEEAEKLSVQAMETRKTILGADHPNTLISMANLASMYWDLGRWEEAEKLAVQVMERRKTKLGADHPDTWESMHSLASIYWGRGRWEEAEKLNMHVMETRKAKLGADHPDTLGSMNNLATTYVSQCRWEEAEKLLVKVIERRKTKLGADHPDTLTSMANLAVTYMKQSRLEEAEKLNEQVMETRKTKLGADHPDTLTSMACLAVTYMTQSRLKEAEKLNEQVMERSKTKLGADHPDTLNIMNNLATTYSKQDRWEEAEKLEMQAMETYKTKLGADNPETLTCMVNLASIYRNQGRLEEAEKLNVQAVEIYETKLRADHPDTLNSIDQLAVTYKEQGRWEEAEKLSVQAMETRETKLGADHPDTLSSMNNLAVTYMKQGRWEEAEKLQVKVMETHRTKLGADHPGTLTSMNNLAFTWKRLGRDAEAILLMNDYLRRQDRISGPEHPRFLSSFATFMKWVAEHPDITREMT